MPDTALTNCVRGLSAVFIFGGDIKPADDPNHLGGLGYRSLHDLEGDKTGAMPSYVRVLAGAALYRINPKLVLIHQEEEVICRGLRKALPAFRPTVDGSCAEVRAAL
jgi:hypothetical protein